MIELACKHYSLGSRRFLDIKLDRLKLKKAIHERDAESLRSMLERLSESAENTSKRNWRCVKSKIDWQSDEAVLTFQESPGSHHETILTHDINRLLEVVDA